MYFGQSPLWNAGHESAGATAPSTSWFLAEGATGPFFETFVLIANPNDAPTDVTITFLPDTGVPVTNDPGQPARIHALMRDKYGWADRVVSVIGDRSQSIAVRLDPAAPTP